MGRFTGLVAASIIGIALTGGAAQAQDAAEDVIKTRQAVMMILQNSLIGIGNIAQGKITATDDMAAFAAALAEVAPLAGNLYPAGTGPESGVKTRATAAIWEDPAGFQAAVEKNTELSNALLAAAQSGDPAAVGAALGDLGKNGCGACHTNFRSR